MVAPNVGLGLDEFPVTPNNRILVSIRQAFGVKTNRFGSTADSAIVTGRLEELYG
jgi:hypothetical protein